MGIFKNWGTSKSTEEKPPAKLASDENQSEKISDKIKKGKKGPRKCEEEGKVKPGMRKENNCLTEPEEESEEDESVADPPTNVKEKTSFFGTVFVKVKEVKKKAGGKVKEAVRSIKQKIQKKEKTKLQVTGMMGGSCESLTTSGVHIAPSPTGGVVNIYINTDSGQQRHSHHVPGEGSGCSCYSGSCNINIDLSTSYNGIGG